MEGYSAVKPHRFQIALLSKCFPSTLKHKAGVFKFLRFEKRFWFRNVFSFIFTVRPTVHPNPSRKQNFSKTFFDPEEFENTGFKVLANEGTLLRTHCCS